MSDAQEMHEFLAECKATQSDPGPTWLVKVSSILLMYAMKSGTIEANPAAFQEIIRELVRRMPDELWPMASMTAIKGLEGAKAMREMGLDMDINGNFTGEL